MGDFSTYSPDLVIVSFDGIMINGFANDTFVEVERDEDGFMKYTGSLGDVARSRNLNRGGKVTLTLMAVAPVNDLLAEASLLDEENGNIYGVLQVKDLSGNVRVHSDIAWIQKIPNVERGKESGTVQWVFDCAELTIVQGGNVI